ncbi:MAG: hydroxyacylglutathione hydrolase [Solirubrobacteraceae bacterium]|nr:hydroxyacylglutathione hydrolase [Solirubrobacteraceae bacterium]
MKQLADGVWVLPGFPPNAINAWVIEDVLLDAKTRWDARFILRALRGRTITAHAITHAHPDHQGSSHAVCEALGIPFWVPEHDADAAENPRLIRERQPNHPIAQFMDRAFTGPGHRVDRQLHDGDEVAGFRVIDAPGHSAGHVVYFRESDRTLIVGDVLNSADPLTMLPGLRLPKDFFTPDPAQNRVSARKLAELEPALVLFGHGPPVRDTRKFVDFCAAL